MLLDSAVDEPDEVSVPESPAPGDHQLGELVLVATPLGNLGDITRRALETLKRADVVFCEDTRHSRALFSAYAISPRRRLRALHEHNEASLCDEVVALVAAGLRVTTAPGPSSVVAALSVSGLPSEQFVMEGFVARRPGERRASYERWAREPRTIVFFESPQRLAVTLAEIAERFPLRSVAVVRELTKLHEEIVRGSARDVAVRFASREVLGEIVVILAGAPDAPADESAVRAALRDHLARGVSVRDAATAVASDLGVAHRDAYRLALTLRDESPRPPDQ